jgi:hypothetical protein
MTILDWFIVSLFGWLFINVAVFGLMHFQGRRASKRRPS